MIILALLTKRRGNEWKLFALNTVHSGNGRMLIKTVKDARNALITLQYRLPKLYEYYGGYWYGDPRVYAQDDVNKTVKSTFGDLYNRTMVRENLLRNYFSVVTRWGP